MMAQSFPPHAGMGPGGHPGLPHGHPMAGMQHPGAGHMGGPNTGMMQGMHPGVSGPQVTQAQMIAGMPHGPVTSGPGAHAMAHLGPQPPQPMFHQQNSPVPYPQLGSQQQQQVMRQRQFLQLQAHQQQQQQQQQMAGMMQPQGNQNMTQQQFQQIQQMKAGMNMPNIPNMNIQQMQMQAQANANAQAQQQQSHHQQQLLAQHQRQMLAQHQQAQRNVSQQMTMTRSQEQASQPPQSIPTPAPQNPVQMQQQPAPQNPVPNAQPKQQPQQPNPQQQPQQSQGGTPQQANDVVQVKQQQDMHTNQSVLEDVPMNEGMGSGLNGQGILRLLMFQEQLCPQQTDKVSDKVSELEYWEEFVRSHFSPFGVLRQQLHDQKTGATKVFQIQFASLARFYHAHFTSGVKEMRMEPIGCTETKLPHGGCHVYSPRTYITYVYENNIQVITDGGIQCNFDLTNRIEYLSINTKSWTEYVPRGLWPSPDSPDQKQSPKMSKNAKKPLKQQPMLSTAPSSCISDMGVPEYIVQFLEIAEVMMVMGPLMEFSQKNPDLRPQDAMHRMVTETAQNMAQNMRMNQMAANANGGIQMNAGQRTPGLNGPNQFASPAMNHLGLPQQGSPHIGGPAHTPSPAHLNQGGIAMVHQMSQGNSNLSGSQGPSTNTSPHVPTKRRRASQVKLEDENASQEVNGANKVKPSPRIGGKRQKGTA